ncbi:MULTISPECIES: DUF99 family protein [unclassified Wenzhouxiangella]|uniref:endonuclease dU n=1 Tax=unclassified Wenzhouxiangella TaxID=2613841 RepID=UPI000E32BDAD|nr:MULTISPECIES: DUF99 family protein [unclassified Wenzhouxiangella]RFF27728.1 DUF99 family protein [Wenzhouxiangella sp. 15181]RFP69820.1 DUF99 family protein [Wenzhouxiangella sp. 15190]
MDAHPRRNLSHAIGIDDAPFSRSHRGDVTVIGAIFAGDRLEGVLSSKVRRDGINATDRIATMIDDSRFRTHLGVVLLQGIALAGFNVVDIHALNRRLDLPVLVVARRPPDMESIRRALLERVPGGRRKWRLIEKAGPMEPAGGLRIQRAGLDPGQARAVLDRFSHNSKLPEPIRTAHLIAAGATTGESRHRP